MAEKTVSKEAEDDHCCTVCLEEFKSPRLLPCNHTYCEPCLEGILEKSESKSSLTCPQCRAEHRVPPGGPKAFIFDLTISQDIESKKWRKKMAKNRSLCGVCEQKGAATVSYCPQCEAFLCSYCAGAHKRMKLFSSHKIVPAVKYMGYKPKPKPITCPLHPSYTVTFYCNTCNQLICNECVAGTDTHSSDRYGFLESSNHGSHKLFTLTTDSVETFENKLDEAVKTVKSQKHKVRNDLQKLQEIESKHQEHTEDLKKALCDSMESYIKALRAKCTNEITCIDEKSAKVSEAIKEHKKALKKQVAEFNSGLCFAQKAKKCDDDVHKIAMMGQAMVMSPLKSGLPTGLFAAKRYIWPSISCNEEQQRTPSFSQLCGPPLVVRNLENELETQGLLQNYNGVHMKLKSGDHFSASCDLGQKSELSITFSVQPIGQPKFRIVYGGSNFSRELPLSSELKIGSTDLEKSWIVSFTPCCIGTHQVHVQVYGRWISGNAPTFNVTGELKEDDLVQRTPNSKFSAADLFEDGENEDLSDYEVGILTKVKRSYLGKGCTTNYDVEVTWGHDTEEPVTEELSFVWSEYSGFPLELAIPTPES